MLYVRLPVRWFIGDLLHFIFRDRYVGWAAARVVWWGNALSSNFIFIANGSILRPILYEDTVIKITNFY